MGQQWIYNIYLDMLRLPMLQLLCLLVFGLPSMLAAGEDCRKGQVVFGDTCFDACPPNTVVKKVNGVPQCQECDITRLFVLSSDQTRCECAQQTYYLQQQDLCVPCHYSCLTCNGPTEKNCLTCEAPAAQTFRKKNGGSCLCIPGYIDLPQLESTKCTRCHQDCQTCSGPLETNCTVCADGKIKNQLQQCVCANSFVEDDFGMCSCPYPLTVLPDGICKDASTLCGFNQQSSVKIKDIASAAKGFSKDQCACKPGLVRIKDKCGTCKQNEVYNAKQRKCECDPKGFKKKDNKCIVCPADETYNKRTGQCNCKKDYQRSQNGTCVTCSSKSVYRQGTGCGCVFNYYPAKNGKCQKCKKNTEHPSCQDDVHHIDRPRRLDLSEIVDALSIPDAALRSFQNSIKPGGK